MTEQLSSTAMVLAAGLGTRMRPMTLVKPKPLQPVGGRTMLDHALDKLVGAGVKRAVVNVHYLADQIEAHLKTRRDIEIIISRETELLDTGGGIVKALPYFEGKPFFALNADLPWIDGTVPSLQRMQQQWDVKRMEALLLVMPTGKARGFPATGDFAMETDGQLWRKDFPPPRPFVWIGAQIIRPELYVDPPRPAFSNNHVWDLCESHRRLHGIEHDGACFHVGTPEDWQLANDLLASGKGWGL